MTAVDPAVTTAPHAPVQRPGIGAGVALFVGLAKSSEEQLLEALILVAERHQGEYEVRQGATTLAVWSQKNIEALAPADRRYGSLPNERPSRLRAALFGGARAGSRGTLEDLQGLSLLVEQCRLAWTILVQGAKELHDAELVELAANAREHNRRQLIWLRTQIEHDAPETLAVDIDVAQDAAASRP